MRSSCRCPIARALGVRFGDLVTSRSPVGRSSVLVGAVVSGRDVGALAAEPCRVRAAGICAGADRHGGARLALLRRAASRARRLRVERVAATASRQDAQRRRSRLRPALFAQAAMPNDQSTALFASISALVGFLLAFNAMLLMARERRGVIAELRMSRATASGESSRCCCSTRSCSASSASVCRDRARRSALAPCLPARRPATSRSRSRSATPARSSAEAVAARLRDRHRSPRPRDARARSIAAFRAATMDAVDEDARPSRPREAAAVRSRWAAIGLLGLATAIVVLSPRRGRARRRRGADRLDAGAAAGVLAGTLHVLDRAAPAGRERRAADRGWRAAVARQPLRGDRRDRGDRRVRQHGDRERAPRPPARARHGLARAERSHRPVGVRRGTANALATVPFPPTALATIATAPHVAAVDALSRRPARRRRPAGLGDRRRRATPTGSCRRTRSSMAIARTR